MTPPPARLSEQVWMTTKEAADYARMTYHALRICIANGEGPETSQVKPGGHHRIRREWIDNWLEQRGSSHNRRSA